MLNGCDALAFTEKARSNKVLKAVIVNKGRKRSQGRIRIAQVKEYWDSLNIVKSARPDGI